MSFLVKNNIMEKKKVVIVVPKTENNFLAIFGAFKLFKTCNELFDGDFELCLATTELEHVEIDHFTLKPDVHISTVTTADIIIVPSLHGDIPIIKSENQNLIDWLKYMHETKGSEIAAMCSGAIILAATGLLDNKEASSHWLFMDGLEEQFPSVHWVPEKIITENNGIYTSGGAFSSYNLVLFLIEKYLSHEAALGLSQLFEIDYPRLSQLPFMKFNNQKLHGDKDILAVQKFLEQNISENFTNEHLAKQFNMSQRTFIRRFKAATSNTPYKYSQRLRIEKAKNLIESTNLTINEVMFKIGYADHASFKKLFSNSTGFLPSEYKRKYAGAPLLA